MASPTMQSPHLRLTQQAPFGLARTTESAAIKTVTSAFTGRGMVFRIVLCSLSISIVKVRCGREQKTVTTNEGLSSNATGPVIVDQTGRLWIGTLNRGLNWFDGRRFHSITTRNGLSDNAVLSLASDDQGTLWVGTHRGLNCLRDGRVIRIYTDRDGLSGSQIQSLMLDAAGTL